MQLITTQSQILMMALLLCFTVANIIFLEGWNIFSTYVVPSNAAFDNIINPIQENVIIAKNYLGAAYLPDWDFNGIGDLNNLEGYQIKVNAGCSLTVEGQLISQKTQVFQYYKGGILFLI